MHKNSSARSITASAIFATTLILIAFNLRTPFASLPVLLPDIQADLHLSDLHSGNFTTLPTLCLGLFAPFAPYLARRFGIEKTMFLLLIVLAVGIGLRGVGTLLFLYLGAVLAGGAIAVSNVLLPALVKRDFANHMPLMTGFYTMGICGGAALAAAFTVPLQQNAFSGSWQLALSFWALPVLMIALIWLVQIKGVQMQAYDQHRHAKGSHINSPHVKGLWRDKLAWQITLLMGFQSAMAYIGYGWMSPILHERGLSLQDAGHITSLSILAQMVGCLVAPLLIGRRASQSGLNVSLGLVATAGFIGIFLAPMGGFVLFCALLQGFGQGSMLAAAMMMIVLRSRDAHVAAQLAGMAQFIGYCLAAGGPFGVGLVREWGGSLGLSALVPLGVGLAMAFFGALAGRPLLCKAHSVEILKKER